VVHGPSLRGRRDRSLSRRVTGMPEDIEIHPVRESEYAAAGEATARAYMEFANPGAAAGWDAYLARIADVAGRARRTTVLVASVDGNIAGSATLEIDARMNPESTEPLAPDEAHLRMLGVEPAYRGRGVARRLVVACLDVARARGRRMLTLETAPVMTAAQQLYTSMGFAATGDRVTPDGLHLLEYSRSTDAEPMATR
jgi:ribosomal protein S18 acetylase RimI-like enzyme